MGRSGGRSASATALAAAAVGLAVAALWPADAPAQARGGDNVQGRKRQAVEICSRELGRRVQARSVAVERIIDDDYRGQSVDLDAYMKLRRDGPDRTVRMRCVVEFAGSNRITRFDVDGDGGGAGGGGSGDRLARACWQSAERVGYRVREVVTSRAIEGWGRAVLMQVGNGRVLCTISNSGNIDGLYEKRF